MIEEGRLKHDLLARRDFIKGDFWMHCGYSLQRGFLSEGTFVKDRVVCGVTLSALPQHAS